MKALADAIQYTVAFEWDHYHLPPKWVPRDEGYKRQWLKLALNSRYPLCVGTNYIPMYDLEKTKKVTASAQLKLLAVLEKLK